MAEVRTLLHLFATSNRGGPKERQSVELYRRCSSSLITLPLLSSYIPLNIAVGSDIIKKISHHFVQHPMA